MFFRRSFWFSIAALWCVLVGVGSKVWAQTVVSATPRSGEIRLMGTVQDVRRDQNRFVLVVQQVQVGGGPDRVLPTPKTRLVAAGEGTTFAALISEEASPIIAQNVSEIAAGTPVLVIGRDPIPSKNQPALFVARLVCVLNPPVVEPQQPARPASDPPGRNLLLPTDNPQNWTQTIIDPAQATVEAENGTVKIAVSKTGKEDWRVQLAQTGAFPEPGVSYTLSFRARATPARQMRVSAQVQGSDFHDIGINRFASVGTEWAQYEYTFVARHLGSKGHLLPVFFFGTQAGATWLADVRLAVSFPHQRGNLLEAVSNPGAWKLLPLTKEGHATLRTGGDALEVSTDAAPKEEAAAYHLLPTNAPLLVPGRRYVLTFRAKSGTERVLRVRGISEPITLSSEEKAFELPFQVRRLTDFGLCPTFVLPAQVGTFSLSNPVIREADHP